MAGINLYLEILLDMSTKTCLQINLYSTLWITMLRNDFNMDYWQFLLCCYDAELFKSKKNINLEYIIISTR